MSQTKYSEFSECVSKVRDVLEQAAAEAVPATRAGHLAEARETAENCLRLRPGNVEANYVAGLAMYYSFCEDQTFGPRAQRYLQAALTIDPNHPFAQLYQGHFFYDSGLYDRALVCFRRIDLNVFASLNQSWRVLKVHELILCCRIRVNDIELSEADFNALVQEYLENSPEDVPVPSELATTLAETKESGIWQRISRDKVRKLFTDMVERLSFAETLKDLLAVT